MSISQVGRPLHEFEEDLSRSCLMWTLNLLKLNLESAFPEYVWRVWHTQMFQENVSISCKYLAYSDPTMMISIFKITYFQPCSQKMHNLILTFFGIYENIACRCCSVGMTNIIDVSWFWNVNPSKESMIVPWELSIIHQWAILFLFRSSPPTVVYQRIQSFISAVYQMIQGELANWAKKFGHF